MSLRVLLILGLLSAFGPLAIDMYLPGFPTLARVFDTDVGHVQMSLTAYFIGLALGQLVYGPLADRFGRRPPLLFGVGLFLLASIACAYAPSLDGLILARFFQALGGCAGMVISRAVVRDLCDSVAAAKAFSQLMLIVGLAPILAPVVGGILLESFGWRSLFLSLVLFSALAGLGVGCWLPETVPLDQPRLQLSKTFHAYRMLLADRLFMTQVLTGGLAVAGMFAYIAGSPYVFIELYGIAPEHYGWLFGSNSAGFMLASQINVRLLKYRSPATLMRGGCVAYCLCCLVLLLTAWGRPASLWPMLIPLFTAMACLGCILPNAAACAMSSQQRYAGSASALMGSVHFTVAATASYAVTALHDASAVPMALVITVCSVGALSMVWLAGRLERGSLAS